jgi:hypothetical protein
MKNSTENYNDSIAAALVDELEKNLNEQISLNRQYSIDKAMEKANICAGLIDTIKREKILEKPEFADKKKTIKRLYKELEIIITVNQQEVGTKLTQVRKAKSALSGYLKSM